MLEREERKQKGYAERWKRRNGETGGNQPASQPGKQLAHNLTEETRERKHKMRGSEAPQNREVGQATLDIAL